VQAAEDAWNTCDPERVALAYTEDSVVRIEERERRILGPRSTDDRDQELPLR
jgi:nuclear transport factor 2 (NTF2) superfamily protein